MSNVKTKESGVELLRFLSIYLIMVRHVVLLVLKVPGQEDILSNTADALAKGLFLSLATICVDVFVIISGWYGIHATTKGLGKLIFQCLFFGICGYGVSLALGYSEFSISEMIKMLADNAFPAWFIASYIVLYMMSPILNKFIDDIPKAVAKKTLLTIFVFLFTYGWWFADASGNAHTFISGYSATFLIILYVLTRYIRIHYFSEKAENTKWLSKSRRFWFLAWMTFLFGDWLLWGVTTYLNIGQINNRIFVYTAPMVIAQSFCMFRYFQMVHFKSRIVNWIGSSSVAIMLIHAWCNLALFSTGVNWCYDNNTGVICIIAIAAFLLFISMIGIFLDQLRIFIWNPIESHVKWIKLYE